MAPWGALAVSFREGRYVSHEKQPSYFPLNPGWLKRDPYFMLYEIIPI